MNVLSLFSGVGGIDLGLEAAGMTTVAFCEIDPHARSVLARHWPDVPIIPDVKDVTRDSLPAPVDLVCGGFPCQDISVAGRRQGLAGERSGLWWEFHRILSELTPAWCLIENVDGLRSSNDGRDLGAILGALGDLGYGWSYRVLDARGFGVPQRRRRVFIVGHLGDGRAAEVLLEPEGGGGDLEQGGEAGQVVAALTANGAGAGGGVDDNTAQAGHLIPTHTGTLTANWSKGAGNTQVDEGIVIPVGVSENQRGEVLTTEYVRSIANGGGKPGQGYPAVLAPAYPLAMRGRADGAELEMGEPDVYNSLRAGNGGSSRANALLTPDLAVRRLTPRECERLMGWPDDHTRWNADGQEIADSHRYRFAGNGVVAPVAEWIGRRILAASEPRCACGGRVDPTVDHDPEGDLVLCEDCCPTCQGEK